MKETGSQRKTAADSKNNMKITLNPAPEESQTRLIYFEDLKPGDIFQFRRTDYDVFGPETYLMVNPLIENKSQCFRLDNNSGGFFLQNDRTVVFRVFPKAKLVLNVEEAQETINL